MFHNVVLLDGTCGTHADKLSSKLGLSQKASISLPLTNLVISHCVLVPAAMRAVCDPLDVL